MKIPVLLLALAASLHAASQTVNCNLVYVEEGKESAYPRLSADGKQILYQSNRSGKWQLYRMSKDGKNVVRLTNDAFNNNFPDWSSDNRRIAFVSDRDGNEEIYTMHADGSELKRITENKSRDIHPYFSPDGRYLLFNSTRGNGSLDIYRYTFETGKTERLTDSPDDETCARYAPDMKRIVYLKNNATSDDIHILNTANFLSDNVTRTPATRDGWPMFSADGKWIWYSSLETGTYCIYRIRTDGTKKQKLTNALPGEEDARVSVSADGRHFIYNKRKGSTIDIRSCEVRD